MTVGRGCLTLAFAMLLAGCSTAPTASCPLSVSQFHDRPDLPGQPQEEVPLDAPLLGSPYRVETTSRDAAGRPIAYVYVAGTGWGGHIDVVQSAPDGTAQDYSMQNAEGDVLGEEFGPATFVLDETGIHTIELSTPGTGCDATLRFEVVPDSGAWASEQGAANAP